MRNNKKMMEYITREGESPVITKVFKNYFPKYIESQKIHLNSREPSRKTKNFMQSIANKCREGKLKRIPRGR